MSEENPKDEKTLKEQGTFYKILEGVLGVASIAAIVLCFIPEVNIIGAGIQAAITVVQTGMDLFTKGPKKAALTFATGAALTALCFIPFLGGAAKAAELLGKGGAAAEAGVEGAGWLATHFPRINQFVTSVTTPVKDFFKATGEWIKKTVLRIPGMGKLEKLQSNAEASTKGFMKSNPDNIVSKTGVALNHGWTRTGAEVGLMGAGVGLGMVGDNTTPPNILANPDLYSSNKTNETPENSWTKREDARRIAAQGNSQGIA